MMRRLLEHEQERVEHHSAQVDLEKAHRLMGNLGHAADNKQPEQSRQVAPGLSHHLARNMDAGSMPAIRAGSSSGDKRSNAAFVRAGPDGEQAQHVITNGGFVPSQPHVLNEATRMRLTSQLLNDI